MGVVEEVLQGTLVTLARAMAQSTRTGDAPFLAASMRTCVGS